MARPVVQVTTEVRAAAVNAPYKVGVKGWVKCWRDTAARSDAFVVNETLTMRQRRTYRRLARKYGWKQVGLWGTPNPVFVRKSVWRVTARARFTLHKRLLWSKRWPGFNAARSATVAACTHRHTGERVTFIGTHLVPRGRKVEPRSRERARKRSRHVLDNLTRRHAAWGRTSVVLGDVNTDPPIRLEGVVWMIARGVDQVGFRLGRGLALAWRSARLFRTRTDHKHGAAAVLTIVQRR